MGTMAHRGIALAKLGNKIKLYKIKAKSSTILNF
jgi:hypothetical protein